MLRVPPLHLVLLAAVAVALVVLAVRDRDPGGVEIIAGDPSPGLDELRVDVGGAVNVPSVVTMQPGDRVSDAIERAGGFAPDADRDAVNLARRVVDEDSIRVPRLGEVVAGEATDAARGPLVDVNSASQEELEALPGIGPVYAQRAIEARTAARFTSTDELVEREVWPAHVYDRVRDMVVAR